MAHLARTSSAVTPAELHHSIPHAAWHTLACTPAALRAYRTHTLHRQCTSRRGQGRKLPREDSRLRACSPSSARSCASAAAKRSSADASASVRASMRARCTWASTLHQKSRREGHASVRQAFHYMRCAAAVRGMCSSHTLCRPHAYLSRLFRWSQQKKEFHKLRTCIACSMHSCASAAAKRGSRRAIRGRDAARDPRCCPSPRPPLPSPAQRPSASVGARTAAALRRLPGMALEAAPPS